MDIDEKIFFTIFFATLSLLAASVLAGECSQPGYSWCHEYAYGDATARIALNVYNPPNDIKWVRYSGKDIPYVLLKDGYKIDYYCNGDAYYSATNCNENGCEGARIVSQGTYAIESSLSDGVYMKRIGCFKRTGSYWAWAAFLEFYPSFGDEKIRVLECAQNNDCSYDEVCSTKEEPKTWICEEVKCELSLCEEWEQVFHNISNHECISGCKIRNGRCNTDSDCNPSEACNLNHYCIPQECDDNDPCTLDEYIENDCKNTPIASGTCNPCNYVKIDDKLDCTIDKCEVIDGVPKVSHERIPNCMEKSDLFLYGIIIGAAFIVIILIFVVCDILPRINPWASKGVRI